MISIAGLIGQRSINTTRWLRFSRRGVRQQQTVRASQMARSQRPQGKEVRVVYVRVVACGMMIATCFTASVSHSEVPSPFARWKEGAKKARIFRRNRISGAKPPVDVKKPNAIAGMDNLGNKSAQVNKESPTPRPRFGFAGRSAGTRLTSSVQQPNASSDPGIPLQPPFQEVDNADRPNVGASVRNAEIENSQGNIVEAEAFYRNVLETDPTNLEALIGMGRMIDRQGRFDDALSYYHRASQSHPYNASALNDLGLCYARHDKLQESFKAITQAVELMPTSKLYRNNIAIVLVENGEHEKAWEHLNAVHGSAGAHYNLGYLLYRRGDLDHARQRFMSAVASDPHLTSAHEMLALLRGGGNVPLTNTSDSLQVHAAPRIGETALHVRPSSTQSNGASQQWSQQPIHTGSMESISSPKTNGGAYQYSSPGMTGSSKYADPEPWRFNNTTTNPVGYTSDHRHVNDPLIQMPRQIARIPDAQVDIPPLPNGDTFLYSNSVVEPLPAVGE